MDSEKMKYDEATCYWYGITLAGKKAVCSLVTDILKTRRNFCTEEHLQVFKDHAKKEGHYYSLPAYQGMKK